MPWLTLTNTILARVRDPGAHQHPLLFVRDLLTRLQWLYNIQGAYSLTTHTLTLQPFLSLYSLTEATGDNPAGPQGIRIIKVTQHNRPLDRLTIPYLTSINPNWFRVVGSRLEGFIQLGSSLLLTWPVLDHPSTCIITSTALTPDLTQAGNADLLSIPPESTARLGQLLELLLLLRQRDIMVFNDLFRSFTGELPNATHQKTQPR